MQSRGYKSMNKRWLSPSSLAQLGAVRSHPPCSSYSILQLPSVVNTSGCQGLWQAR